MIAVAAPGLPTMAKNKKSDSPDPRLANLRLDASGNTRIELIADPQVVLRIDDHADALGLSRSAWIRMACLKQMEREDRGAD